MGRWYQLGLPASATLLLATALIGCAAAPPDETPLPALEGAVSRVEVAFDAPGGLSPARATRTTRRVRQSARDWLEEAGRLAPEGALGVEVTVDSIRLRAPLTTWLLSWAAAPDHLAARVVVRRDGRVVAGTPVRVESALSGWDWRDPDERLDRLARRLGRRVAEAVAGGL